jgi:hypothetical protein
LPRITADKKAPSRMAGLNTLNNKHMAVMVLKIGEREITHITYALY